MQLVGTYIENELLRIFLFFNFKVLYWLYKYKLKINNQRNFQANVIILIG